MCAHVCAQAPGLEELTLGGVLDLQAGPWDALGRLGRLKGLELRHRLYGTGRISCSRDDYRALYRGPPPPGPPAELPPEALPPCTVGKALWREERLGWLLDLYPHLAPPGAEGTGGQDGGAGGDWVEGQLQQEGRRHSARLVAPQQQGLRHVTPPNPPAFRLAWLPPGLRACALDLPWGTRVDRGGGPQGGGASGQGGATLGGAKPPPPGHLARFRVQWGAYVVLP
jgi:hypothetical protein